MSTTATTTKAAVVGLEAEIDEPLYYIQDTRQVVGNTAYWWCRDGKGYTTNIDKAWKVGAAWRSGRKTDVLRSCAEVDRLVERNVDVQRLPQLPKLD